VSGWPRRTARRLASSRDGGGLAIVFLISDLAAYAATGLLLPPVAPILALCMAGGAMRAWRAYGERRDRRALRTLFSRFVSAPIVNEIMRERDLFLAGGRPRPQELTATVLFADVAGFTGICERLEPAPLIAWLDRYIDTMAGIIMEHKACFCASSVMASSQYSACQCRGAVVRPSQMTRAAQPAPHWRWSKRWGT